MLGKKLQSKCLAKEHQVKKKGCPRNAFLGLYEEGLVKGIPSGNYTRSKKNKEYAIKAVKILKGAPELSSNSKTL